MPKPKILFVDIDGVITKPGSREIDERAISKLAKLRKKGYKIAFITARSGPWLEGTMRGKEREALIPLLKKYGLQDSLVFAENGLYLWKNASAISLPDPNLKDFFGSRRNIEHEIEMELIRGGIRARDATVETGKMFQVRFVPERGTSIDKLAETISIAIDRLKKEGKLRPDIDYVQKTRSGVNIFPKIISKASAAEQALVEWGFHGLKFRGRAFGDQIEDKAMALRKGKRKVISFVSIHSAEQFVAKTGRILKFERRLRRQKASGKSRAKRKSPHRTKIHK